MINHKLEMQALSECQNYGDVECILVDICERLKIPVLFYAEEIRNWAGGAAHVSDDDFNLVTAILAKCEEFEVKSSQSQKTRTGDWFLSVGVKNEH